MVSLGQCSVCIVNGSPACYPRRPQESEAQMGITYSLSLANSGRQTGVEAAGQGVAQAHLQIVASEAFS